MSRNGHTNLSFHRNHAFVELAQTSHAERAQTSCRHGAHARASYPRDTLPPMVGRPPPIWPCVGGGRPSLSCNIRYAQHVRVVSGVHSRNSEYTVQVLCCGRLVVVLRGRVVQHVAKDAITLRPTNPNREACRVDSIWAPYATRSNGAVSVWYNSHHMIQWSAYWVRQGGAPPCTDP